VTEEEMVCGCHELLRRYRLCVGASSGGAYASIRKYFAGRIMQHRPRVVFICPDGGVRYAETVFNPGWYLPFLGRSHGLLHG
jgi:cysteine synthase